MFNKRINARLKIFEEACVTRMDNLEKSLKQITCKHELVVFKEPPLATMIGWSLWINGLKSPQGMKTPYVKECAVCGKVLQCYDTKREWLEARLKAEKKAAEKGKKKTTKKVKKKAAS